MTVEFRSMREKGRKGKKGDAGPKTPTAPTPRWWLLEDEQLPGAVKATIDHIRTHQSALELTRQVCARLYGGMTPGSFAGVTYDRLHVVHPSLTGRLTYNLTSIVTDSLVSKITKSRVRPYFLTQGGDYRLQRRAKKLSQFADGIFYEAKFDELAPMEFRDACVLGDGIIHAYEDWNTHRVAIERVIPSELYVDEVDGFYGSPTQMHRVRVVDRQKLIEAFGYDENGKARDEVINAIRSCGTARADELGGSYQYLADGVAVAESWHLPSGMDGDGEPTDDGEHCIVIDTGVLFREKWTKMRFPFARLPWKRRIYGWHSAGLVEELIGTQVEMNHLLNMMQRAFRMTAAFRIWMEQGTIPAGHLNDRIGTILQGPRGSQPPQFITPQALNPQYFTHFESIKARGFEIARLSQLSAVGQKPAGLDSGEAQRVYHDIESEGFQQIGHQYEQFHLDAISLVIDVVRDIFTREKSYKLRAPMGGSSMPGVRFLRTIDWKDIAMEEDEYVLKAFPVSSLPSTPQGKLATIQDLARAGYIDQDTARKLIDFPDLQQVQTLLGAAEDWVMSALDSIVEDGKYVPPDPYMMPAMAMKLATQELALGAANKMEQEKQDMLRQWIAQVKDIQDQVQMANVQQQLAAAQLAQGISTPAGQGVGAPAPVSPLLPPPGTQPGQQIAA